MPLPRRVSSRAAASLWKMVWLRLGDPELAQHVGTTPWASTADGPEQPGLVADLERA